MNDHDPSLLLCDLRGLLRNHNSYLGKGKEKEKDGDVSLWNLNVLTG